jgi:hypothetical protein
VAETSLEYATVAALIDKHGSRARSVLAAQGWLDTSPELDGRWPMAELAAMVAGCAARSGSELALGAQVAAGSALALAGRPVDGATKLAVLVGPRQVGGRVEARLWGPPDPEIVVGAVGDGLAVISGTALAVIPDPILPLRQVSVCAASAELAAAEPLTVDGAAIARHEAVTAWMLAVEAFAAVSASVQRTVDYAGARRLFGSTLAAMQVVQHRLVDMHMVELLGGAILARCLSQWSAGIAPEAAHAAQTLAGERGLWAVEQAIQLHGAIGFTWELGLHRALALAQRARLLRSTPPTIDHPLIRAARQRGFGDLTDWSVDFRTTAW